MDNNEICAADLLVCKSKSVGVCRLYFFSIDEKLDNSYTFSGS